MGNTMEIDIGNMILELGYGLGAAIVLYIMYNRMNRTNERTNQLQATLADTVTVMREHASSAPDVKSATLRAAEMDRLYQANHRMMIDGHATIIDGIPASVEQLSDEQHAMAESVNGLTSGLNAFATSSLEQQRKMQDDLFSLQTQATGSAVAQAELVEHLTANVVKLDNQLELITRALMQMAKSNETFQSASSNAIANIERKLMEEF
ncbi:MAG TPA: hypothetical protein D7I16_02745 [Candidatus Poseidoniales archaeon]|nr:MAG TPA: hypothetical protein D7I16_02745 [Candidatus Poseidoniales archaeon]